MKSLYKFLTFCLIVLLGYPAQKAFSQTSTYNYIGGVQTYTVGVGVSSVSVDVRGAAGGQYPGEGIGGNGGRVQATLAVTPGELLYVYVGQQGTDGGGFTVPPGGLNSGGGADGGSGSESDGGAAGGASSDIRSVSGFTGASLSSRVAVGAGGGGGAWDCGADNGGDGGGTTGSVGSDCGTYDAVYEGGPGTPTAPGAAGDYVGAYFGTIGGFGYGGNADPDFFGGGGGGGWYGAGGAAAGGGCGGSSYAGTGTSAVTMTSGYETGSGQVIINVLCSTPVAGTITGPNNVCAGSNITVADATGTAGGVWTSSAGGIATVGTSSGIISGISAGTAIISYTIALSCGTAVATYIVTVNPLPDPITGPANVCVGSTVNLNDLTGAGAWSSTATGIATVSSGGTVLGVSQGTSTIYYTLVTGCRISMVIAAHLPPGPVSGPGVVCMGSTILMSDPATGGAWSSSVTAVATVGTATGLVTPASAGATTITYANGCGTPATAAVVVNPLPAPITGTTSLCITASTLLSDATPGGIWSSAASAVASVGSLSGIVTGISAGPATISYSLPTSCAATAAVTVIPPLAPISGPPSVCQGLTTTLGGYPTGGVWASGSPEYATIGSTSGIVTGISMGTTLITYTAGAGCSATRLISVNPLAPILGRPSVCLGQTTFLTNIVGGGYWSSSPLGIATVESDSGRVTGINPGIATITYALPTGCQSSVSFRVVSFPAGITGTMKACPGTTAGLADTTSGGVWSSNSSSIATVGSSTGVVTGVSASTVSINYSVLPGCTVQTVVTINPLPAQITGNTKICPGTTDSLIDPSPDGLWSSITPSLATVVDTSGVVIAVAGGRAVIVYTLPATGCFRELTLTVNPAPVPIVSYDNANVTFYTPNIYVSYQWYDSIAGIIPGAISPNVAAVYNEYYYVVVTDTNGCMGASADYHYYPATVGIKSAGSSYLARIYPNPSSGILNIESPVRVRAIINGVDGKKEMEQPDAKEIDVSRLASGMYFITLYDDDNEVLDMQKFVKE